MLSTHTTVQSSKNYILNRVTKMQLAINAPNVINRFKVFLFEREKPFIIDKNCNESIF